MIGHMRHGSPPRLMALQSILSPNRRESLPTPSAGVRIIRACRVAASALDRDGELVGCGHHGTGPESKEPDRDARHVVHAIDLLDAEALHEAVLDHRVTASAALLGRLEDQHRRAVEVARLSEVLSGPEQHGGVAVMTTGMHPAGDFGTWVVPHGVV